MAPEIRSWFAARFGDMTPAQLAAIPLVHAGKSTLISAPTGSGKTLTAFLSILSELVELGRRGELGDEVLCVYVSPLKALANDIEKNLLRPLAEMSGTAGRELGVRVAVRSGDTSQSDRARMLRKPPHILITTPETLANVLSAPRFRELLKGARWAIVDEIHEICASKRGTMLALSLERLEALREERMGKKKARARRLVRVGLSATQAPIEEIARFLGGYEGKLPRPVRIIEDKGIKGLDIQVLAPSERMHELPYEIVQSRLYDRLSEMVGGHTTTLVFTNTRSGTERVSMRLKEIGIENLEAHHGSLSKGIRLDVEEMLRAGKLKAVVTSTSLELGIDIGHIDLVCQIGSPKAIAKGLQRIGRSGHGVGRTSKGRIFAFDNDDLIECIVLSKSAMLGKIDRVSIPKGCLDVLAQSLVGMSIEKRWRLGEALELARRSYPYHGLSDSDFMSVMKYLGGQSVEGIYSKLWFDEERGEFGRKKGGRMIYFLNSGTISEESDFQVINDRGRNLGKLSEKFVERLGGRDVFVLGARTYEFLRAWGMRVFVKDATGRRPTVPSWTGEMLPRSFDLSVEVGEFRGELQRKIENEGVDGAADWLLKNYNCDRPGAKSTALYAQEQMEVAGFLPSASAPAIERYTDEKSQHHAIFHFPFGRRANDALSRGFAAKLSSMIGANVRVSINDDGFMLSTSKPFKAGDLKGSLKSSELPAVLTGAVMGTELFKQRFRHCAGRSLLVLRNYRGMEISVSKQQMRSQRIMEELQSDAEFPVVKETLREVFNEVMDVPHACEVLRRIERGQAKVGLFEADQIPSPFAYNIFVSGMSDIVLMEDKAALLREMHTKVLRRILGDGMEPLFQPELVSAYFDSKAPRVGKKEDIIALLRYAGPLRLFSSRGRNPYRWSNVPAAQLNAWCDELISEGAIVSVKAGRTAWALPEDAAKMAALFAAPGKPKGNEEKTLALLTSEKAVSLEEIAAQMKSTQGEAKSLLEKLESRYLATRASGDGKKWRRLDVEMTDRDGAMADIAMRVMQSGGPITAEELALGLGAKPAEVQNMLGVLEEEGHLYSGGITYLESQFTLKSDMEKLRGKQDKDTVEPEKLHSLLVAKHFSGFRDIQDYFAHLPDAGHMVDVFQRVREFDMNEWLALRAKGDILLGRFVGGRVRYVARRDANALHSIHERHPLSEKEVLILSIVGRGEGVGLEDVVKETRLPKETVREAIDALDRGLYIVRAQESFAGRNVYLPFKPDEEQAAGPFPAIVERYVSAYGPVEARRLERLLRIERIALDGALSALEHAGKIAQVRTSDSPEAYYLAAEDVQALGSHPEDARLRVVSLMDPFALHYIEEVQARYGEGWYFPVFRGAHLVGIVEMWEMSGRVDVRNIDLDRRGDLPELVRCLTQMLPYFEMEHSGTYTISGAFGSNADSLEEAECAALKAHGFRKVQGTWALGVDTERVMTPEEAFQYALWKQGLTERAFRNVEDAERKLMGLRSEYEAALRLDLPPSSVSFRQMSRMYLAFTIPSMMTWVSMETARMYRDALQGPLSADEEAAMRAIRSAGELSRKEIRHAVSGEARGKDVLESLLRKCLIVQNGRRRFQPVPGEPGDRRAARLRFVEGLLRNYGLFSAENLSIYTKGEIGAPEARELLESLRKAGKASKGFIVEGDRIPYWMWAEDVDADFPRHKGETLIGMGYRDRLTAYLLLYVNRLFGLGSAYLVVKDGQLLGAYQGHNVGGAYHARRWAGSEEAWQLARRLAARNGVKLVKGVIEEGPRKRDEGEDEDPIEEWAKKVMLGTTSRKGLDE
ncbi:MAG: ATP-dependent helicase [Euryarchaeota archaeon]|nr:ATP-dependent helicase [Euryarchaeota archaeon]